MKVETNGDHVCVAHASSDARAMRLVEITDCVAETGCTPRCAKCIYMSERGEIACGSHAPYAGSDSWTLDRWAPITPAEAAEFAVAVGYAPRCNACGGAA